jgi:hypothetical protein
LPNSNNKKFAKRTTKNNGSTLLLFDNIEKIMEGASKEKGAFG